MAVTFIYRITNEYLIRSIVITRSTVINVCVFVHYGRKRSVGGKNKDHDAASDIARVTDENLRNGADRARNSNAP